MREQSARVICEVNEALVDAENLTELCDRLQTSLRPHIPCDWLALYHMHSRDTRINVATSRGLGFDWDERYSNIACIDPANRRALASRPGTCLAFPEIYDPADERDRYLLEYIRRNGDARMGLVVSLTNRSSQHCLALCLNRQQARETFSEQQVALLSRLQPLITACGLSLLAHSSSSLSRALPDEDLLRPYVLFDERWAIIDFPQRSLELLRSIYRDAGLSTLPAEISDWLRLLANLRPSPTVPRCFVRILPHRRLDLKFKCFSLPDGRLRGLLQLTDKRTVDDFAPLTACGLSPREIELLNHLPAGYTNAQIASALGIKEITVKKRLSLIGDKLGAAGKTEILYAAMARLLELLDQPRSELGP